MVLLCLDPFECALWPVKRKLCVDLMKALPHVRLFRMCSFFVCLVRRWKRERNLADPRKQPLLLQLRKESNSHVTNPHVVDLFAFLGQALTTHHTLK